MADVVIVVPTIPGREADLERCLASYKRTAPDARVIVERGHSCVGDGWRAGAEKAGDFDYLHLTNDDIEAHDGWLEPAIEAVDQGKIPAPLVYGPSGSLDSAGLQGFGQYRGPHHDWMRIGGTTIPFMNRAMWEQIGMVPIHYCADLWVSAKGRLKGYETVIRTGMCFSHHEAPAGRDYSRVEEDAKDYMTLIQEAEMEERYSSHVQVLQALAIKLNVRRVLELGAGDYSTRTFLDLPGLERLTSIEDDADWAERSRTDDERHEMRLVEGPVAGNIPPLDDYDLVFIDDSTSPEARAATIRAVLSRPHPPVVIHDAEVPEYAQAIAQCSPLPATAVVF